MDSDKIERQFHERIWEVTNDASMIERAVSDARELAYELLKLAAPDSGAHAMTEAWLDTYGRDPRKEKNR